MSNSIQINTCRLCHKTFECAVKSFNKHVQNCAAITAMDMDFSMDFAMDLDVTQVPLVNYGPNNTDYVTAVDPEEGEATTDDEEVCIFIRFAFALLNLLIRII